MKKIIYVTTALLIGISFCSFSIAATVDPLFPGLKEEKQVINLPLPGTDATAELGNSMISKYLTTKGTRLVVAKDVSCPPSAGWGTYIFKKGSLAFFVEKSKYGFEYDTDVFYNIMGGTNPLPNTRVLLTEGNLDIAKVKQDPPLGSVIISLCQDLKFEIEEYELNVKEKYKRELIYTGVSKNVISITYREFYEDMARPAFSQDLKFDLGEGDMIGFKGARFKVTSANNIEIKFQALKPLD